MIAQLISKKAGKWLEYEIGESPRKETALNPKHCIDIPYYITILYLTYYEELSAEHTEKI